MYEFHKDKKTYFEYQYLNSKNYVLPFIATHIDLSKPRRILEIGSAEAGVLKAFTETGHTCTGIELSPSRVELANEFMASEVKEGKIQFIARDIYDIDVENDLGNRFDIVILKDVIEHIHDQSKFINRLHEFLNPDGLVFFGFPPWYMPYGGHQQLASKKILTMPYYHILPRWMYKGILKLFNEIPQRIENLVEIKDTAISIERFERIVKKENYKIEQRQFFLINPIYKYKFNLAPRKQFKLIGAIPFIRNFLTTCVYYVVKKDK